MFKQTVIKSKEMLYYANVINKKKFFIKRQNISIDDIKKEHTKYIVFLFTSITLSIILMISLYYNYVGGFFFDRINSYSNVFGKDYTIQVNGFGGFSVSMNFDGNIVNGMEYAQKVQANISGSVDSCKLRAKAFISNVDYSENVNIYGYTNWTLENDGYLYFNQVVKGGEKVGICLYVRMPEEKFFDSVKTYIMTILVEAVNPSKDFES